LRRGGFIVDFGCRTDSRTIKGNTEFLLLEGMRRVDEAEARKIEETVGRGVDVSTRREKSMRWALQKFDSASRIRLVAGMATLILTLLVAVAIWLDSTPSVVVSSARSVSKMEAPQSVVVPPDPVMGQNSIGRKPLRFNTMRTCRRAAVGCHSRLFGTSA
jgi:hypothetical protein